MAAPSRRSFSRVINRIRRQESLTGRKLGKNELGALFEAELAAKESQELGRSRLEFERETEERRAGEFKETQATERRANILRGGASLVKGAGEFGETKLGGKVVDKLSDVGRRIIGAKAATTAVEAAAGTGLSSTVATPFTDIATAEAITPLATPASGAALPAIASKVALPAVVGGAVGSKVSEVIGGEGKGARNTGRTLGAAGAGFLFGGPAGAAIGGVIGIAQSETVICTELYRQGYLPSEVYALDDHALHTDIDEDIYNGYMSWAPYVVKAMKKSWLVTQLVRPFAVGWATHMAHKLDKRIPDSLLGKVVYKIGVPICKRIGLRRRVKQWLSSEIS